MLQCFICSAHATLYIQRTMHQTVVKGHANRVASLTQYASKGNLNIKDRYTGSCMGLMIGFVCYIASQGQHVEVICMLDMYGRSCAFENRATCYLYYHRQ